MLQYILDEAAHTALGVWPFLVELLEQIHVFVVYLHAACLLSLDIFRACRFCPIDIVLVLSLFLDRVGVKALGRLASLTLLHQALPARCYRLSFVRVARGIYGACDGGELAEIGIIFVCADGGALVQRNPPLVVFFLVLQRLMPGQLLRDGHALVELVLDCLSGAEKQVIDGGLVELLLLQVALKAIMALLRRDLARFVSSRILLLST